jgi:predicted nucleotidyltransferase
MERRDLDVPFARLRAIARDVPGLEALILYGSRARGEATSESDWDLGYLATGELDAGDLHGRIIAALDDDRVDLVDLNRAGGQLRYRAASDAQATFERTPGSIERFRLDAIAYWLDMAPIIRAEYDARLERFPR